MPTPTSFLRACVVAALLGALVACGGGQDTADRAGEIWKQKVEAYEQPALDDAVREELEDYVARRRKELGD